MNNFVSITIENQYKAGKLLLMKRNTVQVTCKQVMCEFYDSRVTERIMLER